jgi:kumamolisin
MFGVSPAPAVGKVTFNGTPQKNDNSAMETACDAEFSGALAPGAQIHVFTSAQNSDAGELALFTAILDDNRAKVANYSWGDCEVNLQAQHKTDMAAVFSRAVAQGVNITIASGDSGSACPTSVDSSGQPTGYTDPMADWPAANPNVVAVGGTTLDTSASTLSETAWSGGGSSGGGGGGISTLWALPTWQQQLGAPYLMRSYPDVAFNANPSSGQTALVMYSGFPLPMPIGGTSIAAPQWAGLLTLAGEARANAGKGPIGFVDPVIYAMSAADRATAFDDITSGNIGKYSAGPGWDAATGWGGPHATAVVDYLTAH